MGKKALPSSSSHAPSLTKSKTQPSQRQPQPQPQPQPIKPTSTIISSPLLSSPLQPSNATARRRHRRKRAEMERKDRELMRLQKSTFQTTWTRLRTALHPRQLARNTVDFGKFMYNVILSPFTTPHHINTLLTRVTALEQELATHRQRHAIIMHDLKRAVKMGIIRDGDGNMRSTQQVAPSVVSSTSIPAVPAPSIPTAPSISIPIPPPLDIPMAPAMDVPPPPCPPPLLSMSTTTRPLVIKKSTAPPPPPPPTSSTFSINLSDITSVKLRSHTERSLPASSPIKSDGERPVITLADITSVKLRKTGDTPQKSLPSGSPPGSATSTRSSSEGIDLQEMLNHKLRKTNGTKRSPGGTPQKSVAPPVSDPADTNTFLIQKLSEKFKRSPRARAVLASHNQMTTIVEDCSKTKVTSTSNAMDQSADKENTLTVPNVTRAPQHHLATPGARYHATFSTISADSPSTPWLSPATRSPFIPRGRD